MPACNAPACPRAATCARHDQDATRAVDYSHGHWFDPWHCFFWEAPYQRKAATLEQPQRGATDGAD